MAWNGDVFKASQENPNITFLFPKEGFVIWADTFAIPVNAPHKEEAYTFLNFILRPEIGKAVAEYTTFPIANAAGQKLLPEAIRNNPTIYPSKSVLKHGQFQADLRDDTLALYEQYWEQLKMGG
jgi:spermidine/putrescine transport system substrate-binding protein